MPMTAADSRLWLAASSALPPLPLVASLLDQTLDAIETAQQAGVVHRDLKPDNLFVSDSPTGPFVKLVDHGKDLTIGNAAVAALVKEVPVSGECEAQPVLPKE